MKNQKIQAVALGFILISSAMNAQTDSQKKDTLKTTTIEEVYIKGQSLKPKHSTTKVDVITTDEMKTLVVEQPMRLLEQIPGVDVIAYGQGGVADQFSIRGFSGGGHGGQAGVEIDGVSLNEAEGHSDGYADLNIIIPLNLKKISVYKGPSSALFGRFSQAGTVSLETRKGGNYNDLRLVGGSYKTLDAQYAMGKMFQVGGREDAFKTNFAVQLLNTDGYIKNSGILKGNVSGRMAYQLTNRAEIAVSVLGHRSEWNAPGYITKELYENKATRNQPHPFAENEGGRKMFLSERLDFNYKISDNTKLLLFGYAVQQDFTRFQKRGYLQGTGQFEAFYKRNVYVTGGSFNGSTDLVGRNFNWIIGGEFYSENTDEMRWATNFRRRLDHATNRNRDRDYRDRDYKITTLSFYAQAEWDLHQFFRPFVGVRFDTYGGYYDHKDPYRTAFKKDINNLSHISPKLGLRATLVKNLDFRINLSNGFSLPSDDFSQMKYEENSKIKPIELWQYEAGFSYNNERNLSIDVTGFVLDSSKEILERPVGSGEYVNAGETRRMGIESGAKWSVTEGLAVRGSFTYLHSKIIKGDNEGKELAHLPKTVMQFGAIYTSPIGLGADVEFRQNADYFTSDANAYKDGGYKLLNFKVFYNFDKLFSNKGNIFFAVNNALNELYAETIFGTTTFSAAPERNFSVGLNYSF